ncbi:hypothetical protein [Shewanella sp.]|uniref:hypothetical protein n=1 Tax=Shewanella sp. TaxID=50422 RepID=UPI003A977F78
MDWKDIAGTVGKVAATVAPLLGGPVGVAASIGAQIAGAIGSDNTPEAVAQALQTPDAALKLQQWAHEEREQIRQGHIRMQELDVEQHKADLADRQNARTEHQDHWMPSAITLALLAAVCIPLGMLFFVSPPTGSNQLILVVLGYLLPKLSDAISYWVGGMKDGENKDKLISSVMTKFTGNKG